MNIVIVNSSDTFDNRIDLVCKVLRKFNHNITIISSDFMHIEKKKKTVLKDDYIYIPTVRYKKNISIRRLYSHYKFSKEALKKIKNMKIDLLYLVIPPNSQASLAKRYKHINANVRIIMDIIDLWPESMPVQCTDRFPFTLWASVRNKALKYSDIIITECELYQERLELYLKNKNVQRLYWAKENEISGTDYTKENEKLYLCYLGSINNIIDIDKITDIISSMSKIKPVVLKIIGDGEKREKLIKEATYAGAEVIFLGKIYSPKEKQKIFESCHLGLNIMKKEVCVGLSMKSIEYLEAGLPLINNLRGDTHKLVDKYKIGINWNDHTQNDLEQMMLELETLRKNAKMVYNKFFSVPAFEERFIEILESIEIKD